MKIAILGWGSLLWEENKQFNDQHDSWHCDDGPSIKLEFSRISSSRDGALTLVIDPENGSDTTVAWCLSKRLDPEDAICDLECREGTTCCNIGRVYLNNHNKDYFHDAKSLSAILSWIEEKRFDVVIWTDLKNNFEEKRNIPFSIETSLSYLQNLPQEGKKKAAEYIKKAPDFVHTPLREAVQKESWFKNYV
jgi:hypothetical protein